MGFRVRDPDRDGRTDAERWSRIHACVNQIIGEIERERRGLEARFAANQSRAAFLADALANDGVDPLQASPKLDGLTSSLKAYHGRLAELDRQRQELEAMLLRK